MKQLRLLLLALTLVAGAACGESGITQPTAISSTAPSWDEIPPPPPPPDPSHGSGG